MDDEDEGEWTLVVVKKDKKIIKQKHNQDRNTPNVNIGRNNRNQRLTSVGRTFERGRPNDTATFLANIELSDDEEEDDINLEDIILECPLVWHKFALIGDVNDQIQSSLMKYHIHAFSEVGRLSFLGRNIVQRSWHWNDASACEADLSNYSNICNRKLIFISIIPNFTSRTYGDGLKLYFVHVRFDQYFLAEENPRIAFTISLPEYHGFLGDKPTHVPVSAEGDDIEDNRNNFMRIMKIVEGKMRHDQFQLEYEEEDRKSDKRRYYDPISKDDLTKYKDSIYTCRLILEDSYSGYGIIIGDEHLERKIYLHNRRNCFQAFNRDIVNIMVFQLQRVEKRKKSTKKNDQNVEEKVVWSGRVISVENSEVKPVNKIFLCKLTFGKANLMVPICNTIPVIDVDNQFAFDRVKQSCHNLVDGLSDVNGIENLIQRQVKPEHWKSFANKYFVTLKVLNDKLETCVDRIQFVDSYKCDFIFLVLYRKWSSNFRFPMGEVVGLYTPDASFSKTLPLIAVSCDLSVVSIEEEAELKPEITKIKVKTIRQRQNASVNQTKPERKVFCLKYPNQQYNEVAYSYERVDPNSFRLGIHIVDVEMYVKKGDFLDRYAMKQFFTFLLPVSMRPGGDTKPFYLFSEALTRGIFSINKDREVSVISFYFIVENETFNIKRHLPIVFEEILLNDEFDVKIVDEMIAGNSIPYEYLSYIYKTSINNRIQRNKSHSIPPCWFYPDFTLKMNFSSFIISKEMENLANEFACVELLKKNDICFPVNVKKEVLHEHNLFSWTCEVDEKLCVQLFPTLRTASNLNSNRSVKVFRLSRQFLDEVLKDIRINLFKCDLLFPESSYYFYKLDNIVAWDNVMSLFDVEDRPFTVSMTKPLSSFNDLLLQRLLTSDCNYEDDEINGICTSYKDNKIILKKYWEICRGYEIKDKFQDDSFILDCVFEDITEDSIVFHHPFLRNVYYDKFILFDCLGLSSACLDSGEENGFTELEWRTRIFIIGSPTPDELIPGTFELDDIYMYETKLWRPNLNITEIIQTDIPKIERIASEDKYPTDLTSETSIYMDPTINLTLKLTKSQILRIQFNYNYTAGIMRIAPEVLIVNPHLRVCLGHRHDPFKYFIHPNVLCKINYRRFQHLDEYKEQFRILNRIEGIHQTIRERTSYFIHDVKITWIGAKNNDPPDDVYGIVIIDHSWCKERFIKLGHQNLRIQDPVNSFKRAINRCNMDFIACIQSYIEDKKIYWLGHAQISDVAFIGEKVQKKILLTLKLVHSSFPMKSKLDQNYSLEIMEIPITARVLDRNLRKLEDDTLAQRIVMNDIQATPNIGRVVIDYDSEIKALMVHPYQLNEAQFRALTISLIQEFSLIWGPPGTGKTMVGCIIAFAFTLVNNGTRLDVQTQGKGFPTVLYCGPSNQSVDVVAEKLMKTFGDNCPKLLRIFSSDVINTDFPYPGGIVNHETSNTPDSLKKIALHHIVRQAGKPYAAKFERYESEFMANTNRGALTRKEFSKKVGKYISTLKKSFVKEIEDGNYEIVLCTTVGSCKRLLDSCSIRQVIIDECGMCSEPETLGPLIKREYLIHTVFIGDHMQLRPIITSQAAKGKQLNQSLFERIYNPKKIGYCTMLDRQYRMHPSICEFPSTYFYNDNNSRLYTALSESWSGIPNRFIVDPTQFNGLQYSGLRRNYQAQLISNNVKIADDKWKGTRKKNFNCYQINLDFSTGVPIKEKILFIKVEGFEVNQAVTGVSGNVKSKGNKLEVVAVEMLYKSLIEKIPDKNTASQSILVLTQYRLQESLLKKACATILNELKIPGPPKVSTVIRSQGSECDYVIFSTVRSLPHKKDIDINPSSGWISKYLGFITDKNQLNVAITRAKKGLFIIGNRDLLSVNQHWKALIDDLQSRGCVAESIFDVQN